MKKEKGHNIRLQELMVFQAILANRSITTASEILGLTQSSLSKQLKFLRSYFDDELFVRTGSGMVATSKALALAPQIATLINNFESLHGESNFNPKEVARNFIISTTDEVQHYLLPQLVNRIEQESPRSRIIFRALERDYAAKQLESGNVDIVISLNWHIPEHLKQRRLFSDDFVCIHRTHHPLMKQELTLKKYLSAQHMMVSPLGTATGPIDEILDSYGHKRNVRFACPYFMSVADALKGSDMILTLQRRACDALVKGHPLVTRELPFSVNPVSYFLFWHKRYDKDSTNCWLRGLISELLYV